MLVRDEHHDDVALRGGIFDRRDFEPLVGRLFAGGAAFAETDDNLDTAVVKVERVGVSLAPVSDYSDRFVAEQPEIGVLVVIHLHRVPPLALFGVCFSL